MKFICTKYPQLIIGLKIEFKDGVFETADQDEIASLKAFADKFGIEQSAEDAPIKPVRGRGKGQKKNHDAIDGGTAPQGEPVMTAPVEPHDVAAEKQPENEPANEGIDMEALAARM